MCWGFAAAEAEDGEDTILYSESESFLDFIVPDGSGVRFIKVG